MAEIIEAIKEGLQSLGIAALRMLPPSPFIAFMNQMESQTWLKWLNWIIPIGTFVAILEAWLACVSIFYIYQLVLRWAKAIE